uniref:Uncharacterized protein n=1 Tax=Rhizophora mucronata TaxID=61149 RepID=A0A2P2PBJ1_RHIMU
MTLLSSIFSSGKNVPGGSFCILDVIMDNASCKLF